MDKAAALREINVKHFVVNEALLSNQKDTRRHNLLEDPEAQIENLLNAILVQEEPSILVTWLPQKGIRSDIAQNALRTQEFLQAKLNE